MNEQEDIPIIVPPQVPKKNARIEALEMRLNGIEEAIGILSRSIQQLGNGLQTPTAQGPLAYPREPIPVAPASNSGGQEMIAMMKGFLELQNTMKVGLMQDIQMASMLLPGGDDGGEDDPLMDALTPLIQQYAEGKMGQRSLPSPSIPTPPSPYITPGKPVDLQEPYEDEEDEEE